jgi:hypothetical protein
MEMLPEELGDAERPVEEDKDPFQMAFFPEIQLEVSSLSGWFGSQRGSRSRVAHKRNWCCYLELTLGTGTK